VKKTSELLKEEGEDKLGQVQDLIIQACTYLKLLIYETTLSAGKIRSQSNGLLSMHCKKLLFP
jgi:hypothetical protein